MIKRFFVLLMLLLSISGCGAFTTSSTEPPKVVSSPISSTNTPQPTVDPDILLQDDFSDENSGWYSNRNNESSYYYANGEYFIQATKSTNFHHVSSADIFKNMIFSVDVRHLSGDDSLTGSLIVWKFQDNQTFYALTITDDGTFAVHRYYDGNYQLLKINSHSEFLKVNGQVNHITIAAFNQHNDIYFNNQFVFRFDDTEYITGSIGFGVFPDPTSAVQVAFDNLRVADFHLDSAYIPEKPELTSTPDYLSITWNDLVQFLANDHTNWNTYDLETYNCLDFAIDLVKNANQNAIQARIVAVNFEGQEVGHAFVEFLTSDRGAIFVEPQGDNTYSNVVIGNPLCDDWNQFECMGTISSIEYFTECNHSHECSVESY